MRVALLLLVVAFAGCVEDAEPPAATPSPGEAPAATTYQTARSDFDLGVQPIQGSQGTYLIQIRGEQTLPAGEGPFPVAILMHGRHGTCAISGAEILLQPCPSTPVTGSVESYRGYRMLADSLAKRGVAVFSVDANNVNDRDNDWGAAGDDYGATARARIIFAVLDEMAAGEAFADIRSQLDLDTVGLMGHSRGGEGVIRAAVLEPERFAAIMALAPTDFARWRMPSVPFATILPYCDGDVSNLQGAWAYDDMQGGPKHQFLHMGANHNWYNTVWYQNDWSNRGDPYCDIDSADSGRLDPGQQEYEGAHIMATFFDHYLNANASAWPVLEGSAPWGFDVKTSSQVTQPEFAQDFASHPDDASWIPEYRGVSASRCNGGDCPMRPTYSTAPQTHVEFTPGGTISWKHAADNSPVAATSSIRIGLAPGTTQEQLAGIHVFFEDAAGATARFDLAPRGLFVPPGDSGAKTTLNMVWMEHDAPIDWSQLVAWGIGSDTAVSLQFTDWLARDGAASV
ncbi:MAG: alpha/beta hydrolase family protein [Thermoplasmatota archaeon]